ncbi:MAG TPA: hypothetical protein VIU44_00955 [Gaiellaceae bacterium]|jgi:hypothetical protein
MSTPSYAVIWQDLLADGQAPVYAGKLELDEGRLRLEGISRAGRSCLRTLRYDQLHGLHMAKSRERIAGRPTLVVEREEGEPLRVGSVDGRGLLPELADQLSSLAFGRPRRH